jgi:diguanylate cyclase (GGDEF)-like protein
MPIRINLLAELQAGTAPELKGRWVFLMVDSGRCDDYCQRKLYAMRQVRLTQGKDMERIERAWLLDDGTAPAASTLEEYKGTRVLLMDQALVASVGATFEIKPRAVKPDPEKVAAILDQIGKGPNGRPWDCRACGFNTCQRFAEAAALGRASMRQCAPFQERRADEAQRAAAVDSLTGLSTYRVLRDRLAFEIERSKRSSEGFAVLFLDLDRFKLVNDQFGHEAGNDVLRAVAGEIRQAVRASDIAARYGGDEFVVILTRTDLEGGARVAEALRAGIEGVGRRLGYPPGLVTVSVGLAEFDPREPIEGDLLISADRALYRAKAAGRNVVA